MLKTLVFLSLIIFALAFYPGELPSDCPALENETLHLVMDRICEVCHEFSSHTHPNLRADCRSQCFSTETFRKCLAIFSPKRHARHLHRHPHRA